MPTVVDTQVTGYAHCSNARCSGYAQEEVPAKREETSWTVGELGGDGAFALLTERSIVSHFFANDEDRPCPSCSADRVITGEPRPQYQPLSGHDPNYLLSGAKFDPTKRNTQADYENAELEAANSKIAALETKLNTLLDALSEEK